MQKRSNFDFLKRGFSRWYAPSAEVPVITITMACALLIVAVANRSLWQSVFRLMPPSTEHFTFLFAEACLLVAMIHLLVAPFAFRYLLKPVLSLLFLISAASAFFMDKYGAIIDKSMIQNVVETHPAEAGELISFQLILYLLVGWALPTALMWRLRINYGGSLLRQVTFRLIAIAASLVVIGLAIASHYREFALIGREHKELRMLVNPVYPVYSAIRYLTEQSISKTDIRRLAEDAVISTPLAGKARPKLVVLVVGETARADNFSLNGYGRDTNPRLAGLPIYNFSNVTSCGTNTAVSVRCMFSGLGRDGYSQEKAESQESILDVLQRVGINVLWRDNNSGCKGVCDRVPNEKLYKLTLPMLCQDGECFDEVLLHELPEKMADMKGDALIVLHQKGSHGPAYYRRTPDAFKVFVPECRDVNVQNCSQQSLINAYDNTIVYTDYLLAELIKLLGQQHSEVDSALIYVSDHGESLGEGGVYLHGFPYAMAPAEQTRIPMMVWLSPDMPNQLKLDLGCFKALHQQPFSHDHLFHSLLGLFDVSTTAYDKELDLFSSCRKHQ